MAVVLNDVYQISDALLKLQKLPPGAQPRAGQLADLSAYNVQVCFIRI